MRDVPNRAGVRSRTPWILLVIPGAVALYALLGAFWHPLLLGTSRFDPFECDRAPWDFVVLGSWLLGALFVLAAIVAAIMRRLWASVAFVVSGVLLIASGALVFLVVGLHDYHLCSS